MGGASGGRGGGLGFLPDRGAHAQRNDVARVREDATRVAREINGEAWSAAVRSIEETLRGEWRPVLLAVGRGGAARTGGGVREHRDAPHRTIPRSASGVRRPDRTGLRPGASDPDGAGRGPRRRRGGIRPRARAGLGGTAAFSALAAGALPRVDAVTIDAAGPARGGRPGSSAAVACGAASAAGAVGRGGSAAASAIRRPPAHGPPGRRGHGWWPARSPCRSCCWPARVCSARPWNGF